MLCLDYAHCIAPLDDQRLVEIEGIEGIEGIDEIGGLKISSTTEPNEIFVEIKRNKKIRIELKFR